MSDVLRLPLGDEAVDEVLLYLVQTLDDGTELVLLENGCWATVDDLPKLHTHGSVPRGCSADDVAAYIDAMDGDA